MARRALYREYRPATFSAVVGQEHITTILKNQVREGKLSHAYLFCGSRGTGKTTSAKILSRAVNCLDPKDGEPCGTCAACRLAAAGSADVIEIDAASNNGVDDVRSLIEQAQFAPLELRYRVFIIDEVHMLSTPAFNALLKTLEEPPAHVLFILATTEPQKLPATIVSRCQRFDFHRLTIAHIVACLGSVLEKAGARIEPNGLRLIARAADGGMRDALSLADQCLSYAGNDVSEQDVLDALGTVSSAMLENTASALLSGNAADAIRALNEVVRNGRDLGVFLGDLSKHFRALLLAKTCGECADLLDCTDDQMQRYLKTAKGVDEARILYASEQILLVQSRLRLFPSPRIPIEAAFVRICRPVDDESVAALEARVALLDRSVPADAAPFLKAVLTGDRGGLDFAAERDLTVAGLSHVVAVSGMHVSLLVGALYLVMGRARRAAAAIGIPLVLIFMLLTGLSPSVVRAGIMLSLLLLAPLLHRESDPPTALSAAALLILLFNPYTVANVGFQLSFLAVAGLLLLTGPLYRHLRSRKLFAAVLTRSETGLSRWRKLAHRLVRRFVNGLLQILCATVGALSLTVPVTCIVFGSLPTYALLSNLLALWAVSLCFGLGLGTAALAAVWPAAGKLLGSIAAWPVRYLLLICRFVSRLPHPSLPASSPYTVAFLVFAYAVLLTVVLLRKRWYGTGLLCVLAALALTVGLRQIRAARADWTAAVLDVGQGQCVCIRCGGRTAVIDCGGSDGDKAGAHAADYLRQSGVRTVDALILSHYDTDHVGGVAELLREIDVRTVYLPAVCFAPEKREALEATASAHGAAVIPVSADLCLPFGSGSLQLFAPVGAENDNDGSVSVLFSERDYDMLVTGDLDQAGEHRLLAAHDLPDIEAFVAGHHGAESSSGMELLKTLRPETVLISVGRNRYGHPSESALARFAAIGAEVLRTDESGDLELKR